MKKAFTLAEVMIVLTVIGVLTAILLPVARQSMPDEDLMKFKKAHNTLGTTIREMVTSDKYFLDGNLALKLNGNPAGTIDLCNSFADILNLKEFQCPDSNTWGSIINMPFDADAMCTAVINPTHYDKDTKKFKTSSPVSSFRLQDDTYIYFLGSFHNNSPDFVDENGFSNHYILFCIDIDWVTDETKTSVCGNECSFGYLVRNDGKIVIGARAGEWLARETLEE